MVDVLSLLRCSTLGVVLIELCVNIVVGRVTIHKGILVLPPVMWVYSVSRVCALPSLSNEFLFDLGSLINNPFLPNVHMYKLPTSSLWLCNDNLLQAISWPQSGGCHCFAGWLRRVNWWARHPHNWQILFAPHCRPFNCAQLPLGLLVYCLYLCLHQEKSQLLLSVRIFSVISPPNLSA